MKHIILCLLVCCNMAAQKVVRFVDREGTPRQPLVRIIDNQNTIHQESFPNRQGYVELQITARDSVRYFAYLDDGVYDRVYEKIDANQKDTLTIRLNPIVCKDCRNSNDALVMRCQLPIFGSYKPTAFKTLNDLPDQIRVRVMDKLRNRVGNKFLKKMAFSSGQLIDFQAYDETLCNPTNQRTFPNRREYQLCFAFSDVSKGLGAYTAIIRVDENGNLLNDIPFPRETGRSHELLPLDKIKSQAIKSGQYVKGVDIEMQYDSVDNILIWVFRRVELRSGGQSMMDEWSYNAHTGQFLTHRQNVGIWQD